MRPPMLRRIERCPENPYGINSYICQGRLGTANLGNRDIRLVEMFGTNGRTFNLCSPDGLEPIMKELGEFMREVL